MGDHLHDLGSIHFAFFQYANVGRNISQIRRSLFVETECHDLRAILVT